MANVQILIVDSMALGKRVDSIEGDRDVVSIVGKLDGKEVVIVVPMSSWEKIVNNADWWRDKRPMRFRP